MKKYRIFHMYWYSKSATDTSLAFGATRSGWWMNGKAFTILDTKKIRIADGQWGSNFPRREKKPIYKRKTESYVFSGFGVSISLGLEWKSTTGRFVTSWFWLFTWKTSSVGEDKVSKWEFCKLKITTIVDFVIIIQRIFYSTHFPSEF